MIEAICTPILLKAVDFFFEEGKNILQERRKRRKDEKDVELLKPEATNKLPSENKKINNFIASEDDALSQKIPESSWLNSETKIKHLTTLLEIYTKNYYLAKEQYAMWGSGLVPPIVKHNLDEAEDAILENMRALQVELNKVYGKNVIIPEVL